MIGTLNKGLNRNIRDDGSTKDPQERLRIDNIRLV